MQEEKLQSGEKKQERVKQYFETELTKAEEGVSKKQQEIDELKQQVSLSSRLLLDELFPVTYCCL